MGLPTGFSGYGSPPAATGDSDNQAGDLPAGFTADGLAAAFYEKMLGVADSLIQQYGMVAALRNNATGALRSCTVAITDYMPRDAATQLANPTERTVLFAAGLGDIPNAAPDWENEQLVTYLQPVATPPVINEILSFAMPLKLYGPGGIIVLYQTNLRL